MYEVSEVPQSYPNTCYKWETKRISPASCVSETLRPSIYQAGVASLWPSATIQGAETLYIYVCQSGWGVDIITYSTIQVRNQENLLQPLWLWNPAYIRLVFMHMTTSRNRRCWNTIYIYVCQRSALSMKWVRCCYHNLLQHNPSEKPREFTDSCDSVIVRPIIDLMDLHHYDHQPQYKVLKHIIMYEVDLLWVWSGWVFLFLS